MRVKEHYTIITNMEKVFILFFLNVPDNYIPITWYPTRQFPVLDNSEYQRQFRGTTGPGSA